MSLEGFGFSGYRSFGHDFSKVYPLKKVNFIIGKNNVGKSNLINFLNDYYNSFVKSVNHGAQINFANGDINLNFKKSEEIVMGFALTEAALGAHIQACLDPRKSNIVVRSDAKDILEKLFLEDDGLYWFKYRPSTSGKAGLIYDTVEAIKILDRAGWNNLAGALNIGGGNLDSHIVPECISRLRYFKSDKHIFYLIPAIRRVGSPDSKPIDFSGEGIIERLAQIQNPDLSTYANDRAKFDKINQFLRDVLEEPEARIEVPRSMDMIQVHMNGRSLPLESVGTGVHEVLILAAAATLIENSIVCVEEPELHLHPLLQKKLIQYLDKNTNNQYFFTTHSAHLLDAVGGEIFHVRQENNISKITAVSTTDDKSSICKDLGYKASDLLQANCIIWVEGPSDRLYIKHWIDGVSSDLIEGYHYSIMFYGGRLFSHLSGEDLEDDISDFISLRKLNRNAVIIFDSDKSAPQSRLTKTKERLQKEFDSGFGFAWVTKGREIENYLDVAKLQDSIRVVHPSAHSLPYSGVYDNLLKYKKRGSKKSIDAKKTKVASHFVENNKANFSILDLKDRVNQLVDFIREVNS